MIVGIMIVLQHLGVVDVGGAVLRGKIGEDPYRKHVNHEQCNELGFSTYSTEAVGSWRSSFSACVLVIIKSLVE